jgi:hypothetical protein
LRLPTQSEVADLLCRDMPVDAVHRALSPWRIVVYEAVRQPVYRPLLVGIDECGSPWVSAQIVAIDAGRRLALTGSATTYRLSPVRAAGEPGSRELAALAQALWAWGVGEALRVCPLFVFVQYGRCASGTRHPAPGMRP